jgi:CheY-like chemotaxis protein
MKATADDTLHILLADDDMDDSFLFNEALEQSQLRVKFSHAEDGNQLINLLQRQLQPDILFLDVNMPYKNGIECLHEIRANPQYSELPIVIYSTTNYKMNIDACYDGGADLYVVKPNTFDEILKMIRKICNPEMLTRKQRPPEQFILECFE